MLKNPLNLFLIFCLIVPMSIGALLAVFGISIKTSPFTFFMFFLPIVAISQLAYHHLLNNIKKDK